MRFSGHVIFLLSSKNYDSEDLVLSFLVAFVDRSVLVINMPTIINSYAEKTCFQPSWAEFDHHGQLSTAAIFPIIKR